MTADLTKGSPIKLLLKFALPFLIGNLFQQFYSFADTLIVGRFLGQNAIAQIGSTESIINLSIGTLCGLMAGFASVTSQRFGAGDKEGVLKSFGISITIASVLAVVITTLCLLNIYPILKVINTPGDIISGSHNYLMWVFIGLFATTMYYLFSSMMRALGNSKTPIIFLAIASILNIALDIVFISLFNMSVEGAGLATCIAQVVSAVLCFVYILKKMPELRISLKELIPDKDMTLQLLRLGIPIMVLNVVICIGGIISASVNNGLGTVYVTVLMSSSKITSLINMPIMSLGTAMGVFAAQNYGAKQYNRIAKGANQGLLLCYIWTAIGFVLMLIFGKPLIHLIAGKDATIVKNGYSYLLVNTAACVLLSPIAIYKFTLNSVGRTFWPVFSGFLEVLVTSCTAVLLVDYIGFWSIILIFPLTWFVVLIPVAADYFYMVSKFKKSSLQ